MANIGVYGMGVMGSNLALNFADHGFSVAVCNVTPDLTDKVLREHPHEQIKGYYDLKAFVGALERPRRVIMMILAGKPVDDVIDELLTVMEPGDMILDTGNSYFAPCGICRVKGAVLFRRRRFRRRTRRALWPRRYARGRC